jgi:hypothetical protein
MNLNEMFTDPLEQSGHRTEKDDNTPVKLSDLRKTKLTIAQLNRLRIMNDVRKLEHEQDLEQVRKQYKVEIPAQPM